MKTVKKPVKINIHLELLIILSFDIIYAIISHMKSVIVLDTNVFVSALLGHSGSSRQVLRGCLKDFYTPLMGNTLFLEYESLLARDKLFASCKLSSKERESLLDSLMSVCQWVNIYYTWRPNLKDEADNHIVELAIAGGAKYIVTKNIRDFKNTDLHFPNLKIAKPEVFLKEVNQH